MSTITELPLPPGSPAVRFFDAPMPLPQPRGPVSRALIEMLAGSPWSTPGTAGLTWPGAPADAPADDDLQLALFLSYELHYRGLVGVSEDWEWHPKLLQARRGWEQVLLAGLSTAVGTPSSLARPDASSTVRGLFDIAGEDRGPSLSKFLMRDATRAQFAEFLVHRSLYHLKEADPHTWALPRLSGSVKAALVTIQADEYGGGQLAQMHAQLFRSLMLSWGLDATYGGYLDAVGGSTLLSTNLITMFGLNRRLRGALVGHLTMFEMTSSVPNARYARGHRRLGGDDDAARFFDEHVVADSVHEQIAAYDLAGGLVDQEPALAGDVIFGARCAQYADELLADFLIPRWQRQATTLHAGGSW